MTALRTRSIGAQFGLVVLLTVLVVGLAGFLAGRSILSQLASLAEDHPVIEALAVGQRALVELHNVRRAQGEQTAAACAAATASGPCTLPGGQPVAVERLGKDAEAEAAPHWESETQYVRPAGDGAVRYTFPWPALKPQFAVVTDAIGTREYLNTLVPNLTSSFLAIYAAALVAAAVLGLLVTFFLSRRLAGRTALLVAYTRRIAGGALEAAPEATRGQDEVGLLADAMHSMARDLDETRQRLVLSEKMQSWQNIARKVAHEIKNPLTPISLVAAELRKRALVEPSATAREFLGEAGRVLEEETASLGRMVREFTAFARLPAPELGPADLLDVVRDFVARNSAADGPRFVVREPVEAAYPAVVDRAMISQVLHNLVNNARLAKLPAQVTITLTLRHDAATYVLDVSDDGPGVPEALRATLFDAYVTSRSTGDGEKGMGLGLTIARKIAADHGGSLSLVRSTALGTEFQLVLPAGSAWLAPAAK